MFVQHYHLKCHLQNFHLVQVSIWEQRNCVVFKERVVDAEEIFEMAQLKSWLWVKHRIHSFNYSFVDWVLNPFYALEVTGKRERFEEADLGDRR